jgi:hypothetical protein
MPRVVEIIHPDRIAAIQTHFDSATGALFSFHCKTVKGSFLSRYSLSGLIVGSWLLPSPNVCRSRRMPVPNGLSATAEVAQEGFHASLQATFGPGCPERTSVRKSGVAMQEGPDSYSGGGVIRLSGDAACGLQQEVPDGLASL